MPKFLIRIRKITDYEDEVEVENIEEAWAWAMNEFDSQNHVVRDTDFETEITEIKEPADGKS